MLKGRKNCQINFSSGTFDTSNIFSMSGRTIRTYTMNICSCNERFLSCKEEGLHYPFILLGQLLIDQKVQVWQELLITILLGRSTRKLGRYIIPICDVYLRLFDHVRLTIPFSCLFSRKIRLHYRILSDTICH